MDPSLASPLICKGPLLWQQPAQLLWLFVMAPLVEEWVVRAGLQETLLQRAAPLTKRARLTSVLLASLAFGALHVNRGWGTALMVTPGSLLIGTVYARRRSWLACACLHAACNVAAWSGCRPELF